MLKHDHEFHNIQLQADRTLEDWLQAACPSSLDGLLCFSDVRCYSSGDQHLLAVVPNLACINVLNTVLSSV